MQTEKVLGFKEKGVWKSTAYLNGKNYYHVFENKLVPVVLKSVYYNALKKKNKRIKKLLQIIKQQKELEEKE